MAQTAINFNFQFFQHFSAPAMAASGRRARGQPAQKMPKISPAETCSPFHANLAS
jgi:hypothetical protein